MVSPGIIVLMFCLRDFPLILRRMFPSVNLFDEIENQFFYLAIAVHSINNKPQRNLSLEFYQLK